MQTEEDKRKGEVQCFVKMVINYDDLIRNQKLLSPRAKGDHKQQLAISNEEQETRLIK